MQKGHAKECVVCGVSFYASPSHKRKYCSSDCWGSVKGEVLTGIKRTQEAKSNISEALKSSWNSDGLRRSKPRDSSVWHSDKWKKAQSKRLKNYYKDNKSSKLAFSPEEDAEVRSLYLSGLSSIKIAERYKVSKQTILGSLERTSTPRRSMKGENHPFWKGGRKRYYGGNWKRQKRLALERDGYECRYCAKSGEEVDLHVHHQIPRREVDVNNSFFNHLFNLMTVCVDCHKAIELKVA